MPRHATSTSFGGKAGNKGNTTKPGPGRPGKGYTLRMKMLADQYAESKRFEQVLKDPDSSLDDFLKVFDRVSDRAYGKAVQPSSVEGAMQLNVVLRNENARGDGTT